MRPSRGGSGRRVGRAVAPTTRHAALAAADAELLRRLDAAMQDAQRRAGPLLGCRPGRTECCHGPFPINQLDADRLRRGLRALAVRDPARARAVRHRAAAAVARLAAGFPGDARRGLLAADERSEARFCEAHAAEPCPPWTPAAACAISTSGVR